MARMSKTAQEKSSKAGRRRMSFSQLLFSMIAVLVILSMVIPLFMGR